MDLSTLSVGGLRRRAGGRRSSARGGGSQCANGTQRQPSAPAGVTGSCGVEGEPTLKATRTSSCQKAQSILPEHRKARKVRTTSPGKCVPAL